MDVWASKAWWIIWKDGRRDPVVGGLMVDVQLVCHHWCIPDITASRSISGVPFFSISTKEEKAAFLLSIASG
jgi:hypothetical protein